MRNAAQQYQDALQSLDGDVWSGEAADAYRKKAAEWIDALQGAATAAEVESILISATGGLCAGIRGLLFQTVSDAREPSAAS